MKRRYTFTASVLEVRGSQTYYVDAETEDEARAKVEDADGVFVCEELEVLDIDKFELDGVDDIPEGEEDDC